MKYSVHTVAQASIGSSQFVHEHRPIILTSFVEACFEAEVGVVGLTPAG